MTSHFRSGPAFGLSAEVKSKLAGKYDPQKEEDLRLWIEDVTGKQVGENFMESLKNGVLLCELINVLQPGSVRKISQSTQNWHQLENIGNFVRAITEYGLRPDDIFEANDLFENTNYTQVQSTLLALTGMHRNVIGLQMGTNKLASQKGMTSYGTRRHLYDSKMAMESPLDQSTISLQMGTNKGASQAGMTAPGTRRHIFDKKLDLESCDSSTISLQMGTNKVASQQGMTSYGLPRQVYDNKYCTNPTEGHNNNNGGDEFDGYQYDD
ncbi:calponin-1 [Pseudochaenichthys georgianus]|uniref:calponin-1 n=1 Tax=Pseudochaenichthys georgianus TaxID=52239 RepID=UPI0039C039CC